MRLTGSRNVAGSQRVLEASPTSNVATAAQPSMLAWALSTHALSGLNFGEEGCMPGIFRIIYND